MFGMSSTEICLKIFSGIDWEGSEDRRKSTFGCYFKLNKQCKFVSWSSNTRSSVVLSTAEDEMKVCMSYAQDCVHLTDLLQQLGVVAGPACLLVNNQANIAISTFLASEEK